MFTTDTPEPVRALLAHASAREALTSLVRRHAMIEVDATAATVTISDAFEDDGSEAAALLALVGCLRA